MIKVLEKKIVEASLRYYDSSGPLLMSDAQFDDALAELRKLDPNHWILKTTGWGHSDNEAKVNHIGANPVGSLDKVKHPETHNLFTKKGMLSPKLDGLSVIVNVYDGKIISLTRNNGIVGKDCTNKLVYLMQKKHPEFYKSLLNIKGLFSIRGEVVTDPSSHDHLKATVGISLRNIAAGMINRNEVTPDLEHLLYVPYFIRIDSENTYANNKQMIDKLESMGSFPMPYEEFDSTTPVYMDAIYKDWQVGFLIDGVVLNTYEDWETGPDYTANESHAIAYKFESESKEAVVEKINWETGSAGRVVPVAVLTSPIELSGAMVQNISCHHAQNVHLNGIGPGAVVRVTRANEVIPYMSEVITPVKATYPSNCPTCNTVTEWDGCYLICPSTECPAQSRTLIFRLFEFCSQPEGLSITTITKWLDQFPVNGDYARIDSIVDFISLFKQVPHKDTASRGNLLQAKFNDHYGNLLFKFENNIQAKLDAGLTYEQFWFILNLKGLGHSSAEKLKDVDPRTVTLNNIPISKMNITVAGSMTDLYPKWSALVKIIKIIAPEPEKPKDSNKYANVVFCMTGVRHAVLSSKLVSNGAVETGTVGKGCNLLIAKDPSSTSGKAQQARAKGIEILSLEEALKRFEV